MTELKSLKYDDTVQCLFFSPSCQDVDWEQLCQSLNETADSLSKNYIWHRDEFKICSPLLKNESDLIPHLTSSTCFGDNIEDEWFIAYLAIKLTQEHQDLIVQIEDGDGDFLLIEAADFLPSWANPETTKNRVFIYNNHIHLIPPTVAKLKTSLKLNDALKFVIEHTEETKASLQIEQAILERIGAYPTRIKELSYRATVTIPVDIAALLITNSKLISPLVNMYCSHDNIDAKNCRKVKFDNCVDISVQFTKFQYAMLLHSKLIPSFRHLKIFSTDKRRVIGFKLACGFEMIMNESRKDALSSMEYKKFLNSLTKNEYFKGNIEGSKEYIQLLERANKYFMVMECPVNSYVTANICKLLTSKDFFQIKESIKQNRNLYLQEEESDDWLNVDSDQLDDLLNKNYRKEIKSEDLIKPSIVTSGLNNFLSKRSDFEGVEENENVFNEKGQIEFDSNQFFRTVENMLDMVSLDKDDGDSSDFSDEEDQGDYFDTEHKFDQELEAEMFGNQHIHLEDHKSILLNLVNSMKEEGPSGPSSNILRSIGINKTDLLDSDDDIE